MIDFEKELIHLISVHLQGCIMGKGLIEKLGKQKYLDYLYDIVEKGADCIMELRTTEAEREIKTMEGINYLFTQYDPNDIKKRITNYQVREQRIFIELIKKDHELFLQGV